MTFETILGEAIDEAIEISGAIAATKKSDSVSTQSIVINIKNAGEVAAKEKGFIGEYAAKIVPQTVENQVYESAAESLSTALKEKGVDASVKIVANPFANTPPKASEKIFAAAYFWGAALTTERGPARKKQVWRLQLQSVITAWWVTIPFAPCREVWRKRPGTLRRFPKSKCASCWDDGMGLRYATPFSGSRC